MKFLFNKDKEAHTLSRRISFNKQELINLKIYLTSDPIG